MLIYRSQNDMRHNYIVDTITSGSMQTATGTQRTPQPRPVSTYL